MHCGQCGNEIDLRNLNGDGSARCQVCGAVMPASYVKRFIGDSQPPVRRDAGYDSWGGDSYNSSPRYPDSYPAPQPVPRQTGRRVIGIFSLILGIISLVATIFGILVTFQVGPGFLLISLCLSVLTVVLGGIGKGGCHIAGLVLGIISLVLSTILFAACGGMEIVATGKLISVEELFKNLSYAIHDLT